MITSSGEQTAETKVVSPMAEDVEMMGNESTMSFQSVPPSEEQQATATQIHKSPDSLEQELLQSLPHMMPTSTATSTRKQFKKRSRKQPQQKGRDGKNETSGSHNKNQEPTHREEMVPLNDSSATTSMQNSSSTTSLQNSASTSTFQTSSSTSLDYQEDDQQQQQREQQEQECSSSLWKGKSVRSSSRSESKTPPRDSNNGTDDHSKHGGNSSRRRRSTSRTNRRHHRRSHHHHSHSHSKEPNKEGEQRQESFLTNTVQRVNSQDLNGILGIDSNQGENGEEEEKSKQELARDGRSVRSKHDPSRRKRSTSASSKSKAHRRSRSDGAAAAKEIDAVLGNLNSWDTTKQGQPQDDPTVNTVHTLWEMKEMFQKEFPDQPIPSDETLRQRYKQDSPSRSSPKKKAGRRPLPPHSPKRRSHNTHPNKSSPNNTSSSSITTTLSSSSPTSSPSKPQASVKTLISKQRWGNGGNLNDSSSSIHSSMSSSRMLGSPIKSSSPASIRSDVTPHDMSPKIPQLPFSVHSKSSSPHNMDKMDDSYHDFNEFGGEDDDGDTTPKTKIRKSVELPPPSSPLQMVSPPKRINSLPTERMRRNFLRKKTPIHPTASPHQDPPKQDSVSSLTSPSTTTIIAGDDYYQHPQGTSSGMKPPSSADSSARKGRNRNAFFKNKLRTLLGGKEGEQDRKPLMLLDDSEHDPPMVPQSSELPNLSLASPSRTQRKSLASEDSPNSHIPKKKNRLSGATALLSSVLGMGSSTDFGELDCPSSDDDNIFVDEDDDDTEDHQRIVLPETLSYEETPYVDVMVALKDDRTTIEMDEEKKPSSEPNLSTVQLKNDQLLKQVEEARMATRRNRLSSRHKGSPSPDTHTSSHSASRKRSSKSPSRRSAKASDPTRPPLKSDHNKNRSDRNRSRSRDTHKVKDSGIPRGDGSQRSTTSRHRARSNDGSSRRERQHSNGSVGSYSHRSTAARSDRRRARSYDAKSRHAASDDISKSNPTNTSGTRKKTSRSEHRRKSRNRSTSLSNKRREKTSGTGPFSSSPVLRRPSGELDDVAAKAKEDLHIPTRPVELITKKEFAAAVSGIVRSRREAIKNKDPKSTVSPTPTESKGSTNPNNASSVSALHPTTGEGESSSDSSTGYKGLAEVMALAKEKRAWRRSQESSTETN